MPAELAILPPSTLPLVAREIHRDPRLKSAHSRRGYLWDLNAFETWRGQRPLTRLLVEEYAAHLQRAGRAPASVNRALAAVRWWARRIGDLAFEDSTMDAHRREEIVTQAARVAGIQGVRGERAQKGRHIGDGELAALLRACYEDGSPSGRRDAAIIALAWQTGARRAELAGLLLADVVLTGADEGEIVIRGKGDKVRRAYIYNGAVFALQDWLAIRGDAPGFLWQAINKAGAVQVGYGVSDEALAQMLAKRARAAGVKHLTWHDFRRTFAGNLLDAGHDLATVQRLMGHASPTTTSNYDRRGEEVRRRAVRSLHVPYLRRA